MRRLYVSAVLLAIVGLTGTAWIFAQGARAPELTPQDYADIEHLTARLNQGVDSHDAELWASAFAEDGTWVPGEGGRALTGHAALKEYRNRRRAELKGNTDERHWTNSLVVTR